MKRRRDPFEQSVAVGGGRGRTPFAWVLEELAPLDPTTRPMFGCTAVYARGKIVFILREKGREKGHAQDDGVWVATTREHHESLRRELPSMRSITVFGSGETGWQVLPVEGDGFEEEALRACALVRADDARIGKVPKAKKAKAATPKRTAKKAAARRSPPARSSRSRRAP